MLLLIKFAFSLELISKYKQGVHDYHKQDETKMENDVVL